MGLDMYAHTMDDKPLSPVDFEEPKNIGELHYWRKHPNLHGWMHALYLSKGGTADALEFNCKTVLITTDDLDNLEFDVKANNLPNTEGFFFGESQPEDAKDDLAFLAKARNALENGDPVFYSSWW